MLRTIALLLVVSLAPAGCVSKAKQRYEDAREAFDACMDEHPDDPSACDAEREAALAAGERYEDDAQRAWGCRSTPDRCYSGPGRTPPD